MSKIARFCFALLLAGHLGQFASRGQDAAEATDPQQPKEKAEKVITPDQEKWIPLREGRRRAPRRLHNATPPVFGANVLVKPNESVRELVLFGGNADIQGSVERDVVVIGGNANVSGNVGGCVVVIGGELKCDGEVDREAVVVLGAAALSDKARIGRSAVLIGGPFDLANGVHIGDQRVVIPLGDVLPKVLFLKEWLIHGPLMGRLLPIGIKFAWIIAGIFAGVYFAALLVFPKAVKAVYLALEERPVASIFSGMLTLILLAPLTLLLVVSVVGIAVVPFLKISLLLALIFGKVGVICFIGRGLGRTSGASVLQAPILAFIIGTVLLLLAYMTPLIGLTAWMLATVFGLGGAVIALSRTFKREETTVPLAPVAVAVPRSNVPPSPGSTVATSPLEITPSAGIATGPTGATGTDGSNPPLMQPSQPASPQVTDTVLLARAGFWWRFLAAVLDFIPLVFLIPLLHVGFIPVAVGYFVGMWTWKGTTLGSLIMGLKIVRTDGGPVTFSVALVRCLSSFFSALILFLGFFWMGWDRNKQAWHDKIAGTVVVRMPKDFALL